MSNYQNIEERLSLMFKALGNPYRLAIFQRLSSCCQPGSSCTLADAMRHSVGELGEGLEIAPSTLSHHLKELHHAGLIEMARQGQQVMCWIDPAVLIRLADFFHTKTNQPESTDSGPTQ